MPSDSTLAEPPPLAWTDLVDMRPEFTGLLEQCRNAQPLPGDTLCALAVWYGYGDYSGFKRHVVSLVGLRTGCPEHRDPLDPPMESGPVVGLFRSVPTPPQAAPCAACEALDPRLYSMEAYDLAYQTLYRAIPCADSTRCTC